jgi:murein DD-endopeptidase MepM/ murein hydrolase activator NlpD
MREGRKAALLRMAALGFLAAGATATCVSVRAAHIRQPTARTGRSPAAARPNDETCSRSAASNAAFDPAVARRVAPVTTIHLARPLPVQPPIGAGRLIFPLLGPYPGFFDTFGAPRPGVSWHHGDDLFAAKGKPVVAVADGVVFSVGWQRLGGHRLWLMDKAGDDFYYAHLSRYSRLAVDGRVVQAGQTLGYVGNSGDAEQTPPHLHFEIHPASLLRLGYDGAVDPTRYLQRARQIRAPVRGNMRLQVRLLTHTRCHDRRELRQSNPSACTASTNRRCG